MPQLRYEYRILLQYKDKSGNITQIPETNIKNLTIYKDYDKYNMPIGTLDLVIDKNLADKLITNMKEASLLMTVYKIQIGNTTLVNELYFTEEFNYLTDDDLNQFKQQDYAKSDKKEEDKKDVYRNLKMSIISKSLVDFNLKPNNATIYNSSMQDIVVDLLNIGVPLLIEPFSKSELVQQLIIPPKESMAQTLDYLNTVRVFYNSGYRFFMDFENMYLVSKSGKATLRSNDKFDVVKFRIGEFGKGSAINEGFAEDVKNKQYVIDVPSSDISYTSDNATPKELDGFTAIIDASKSIQQTYLNKSKGFGGILGAYTNIMNTIDQVKSISTSVRKTVQNIHKTTDEIRGNFRMIKDQAQQIVPTIQKVITETQSVIRELPNKALETLGGENYDASNVLTSILNNAVIMIDETGKVTSAEDKFADFKNKYVGQIYNIENFKSLVGAITPTNFADNLSAIRTNTFKIPGFVDLTKVGHKESMQDFNPMYGRYTAANRVLYELISNLPNRLRYIVSKGSTKDDPPVYREIDLTALKTCGNYSKDDSGTIHNYIKDSHLFSVEKLKTMVADTTKMANSIRLNENVGKDMEKIVQQTTDIPRDFAKHVLEGANTYVKSITQTANTTINNTKKLVNTAIQQASGLKTSLSSLYQSGATAIDSFVDLSKIGSDGESMIDIALQLTDIAEDLGKRKLIRIPNDNMNLIKNIKHNLLLQQQMLSLTKMQLDNSLFNINVTYMIENVTENSDNNRSGKFLLLNKTETYVNAGERFTSTTLMNFARIPEE